MSDRRIEPEDLGGLEGLPPDDPRLRDLESQPRARAQQRAYREFVSPGEVPEGARVHEAEARLGEALERELGTPIGRAPDAVSDRPAAGGARRPHGGGFLSQLFAPRLRPALAVAAVIVVSAGVLVFNSTQQPPEPPVMRGTTPVTPEGGLTGGEAAGRLADGSLRLTWTASPEAERYAVVFLSPELVEIARVDAGSETHLDLRPGALPSGLAPGARVLWRVAAMRGPDELSRSGALMVTLP